MQCLRFTANWVWPASRCGRASLRDWARAGLSIASERSASLPSLAPSSSDDGGFLPRLRAPLAPAAAPPCLRASSPQPPPWPPWASAWPPWPPWAAWPPWSPLHVSDLSSVPFPSSADNSFPTPPFAPRRHPRRHPRPPAPHEASPESRSSSSGFGSKNASGSQHLQHGSRSGSLAEWRPPPYRPPPAPPALRHDDGASVDLHYEWDRATRTPTPSTGGGVGVGSGRSRDEVEARVRAMKEEFLAFRKRQALRRRSPEPQARVESVC